MELEDKEPKGFWMAPDGEGFQTNRRPRSADLADIGEKMSEIGDKDGSFAHDHFAEGEPVCSDGRPLTPI